MAVRTRRAPNQMDGQLIRCAVAPTEIVDRVAPEWIHVFPAELFNHPWIGNVDPSVPLLDLMVHNNNRYVGDLVVDYNHASVDDEDAPAAGFADLMERRDNGIWAHIAYWTETAREGIESGEWRYISPTWYLAAWSRLDGSWIGPAWHSIALTNTPQIDGLTEVPDQVAAAALAAAAPPAASPRAGFPSHLFLPAAASVDPASSQLFLPPFPAPLAAHTPGAAVSTPRLLTLPLLLAALALPATFALDADDADQQLADAVKASQTPPMAPELLAALGVPADNADPLRASLDRVVVLQASAVDPVVHGELLQELGVLKAAARVRDANLAPAAVPHAMNLAAAIQAEGDPADQAFKAFCQVAPRVPASVVVPNVADDKVGDLETPAPPSAATLTAPQLAIAAQLKIAPAAYAKQLAADLARATA